MDEKKIDELLEERMNISEEEQTEMNKKIQTGIARAVYSRVLIVLTALAVLLGAGWYGVSKYQEAVSFHIRDLKPLIKETVIEGEDWTDWAIAHNYLSLYFELFAPGYVLGYSEEAELEKTENGAYAYHGSLIPWFHVNTEGIQLSTHITPETGDYIIKDGKYIPDEQVRDMMNSRIVFKRWITSEQTWDRSYKAPEIRDEINKLPDSAFVQMAVRFDQPITVEELLEVCAGLPGARLSYAVTHLCPDKENSYQMTPLGISFLNSFMVGEWLYEKPEEGPYPWLSMKPLIYQDTTYGKDYSYYMQYNSAALRHDLAEQTIQHYQSILKLMLDSNFLGEKDEKAVSWAYQDMQENTLKVYGIQIFCTKEGALNTLDLTNVKNMRIEDIRMSRFD